MSEAETRQRMLERQLDFSTYNLPELDQLECDEVFERIRLAEQIVCPDGTLEAYEFGGATKENESFERIGSIPVLLTAEHATTRTRRFTDERPTRQDTADQGTFGVSEVVRQDTESSFLAALGRQTGDANYDLKHPLKDKMRSLIAEHSPVAHLSVHRMFRGRVAEPTDKEAFSVIFGIGDRPSDATMDFIDKAREIAQKYSLRWGINQAVLRPEKGKNTYKRQADGSLETITLAAAGPGTTRTFSQNLADAAGHPFIAAQLEMAASILLSPVEHTTGRRTFDQQRIGVYLGYLFLRECASVANIKI